MTEENIHPVAATFKIIGFKVEAFKLGEFAKEKEALNPDLVLFSHEGNAGVFVDRKQIAIKLKVRVEYEKKPLGEIETLTEFEIVNFDSFQEGGNVKIPTGLWIILIGLSYSTTRGAMISKAEGTSLAKFPMPVVDPAKLIQFPAS